MKTNYSNLRNYFASDNRLLSKIKNSTLSLTKFMLFFVLIVTGFSSQLKAQTLTTQYTFATSAGTYTAITGGTVHYTGAGTGTDGVTAAVTIPSFNFNGTAYTSIIISNNGFITFGATAPATTLYSPLSVNTAYNGCVAGFAINLIASTSATGGAAAPEVRSQLVGSEFIIQYKDMARTTIAADKINFQIRLNTSTNQINIVYGTCVTTSTSTTANAQVGLRGANTSDHFARSVNGLAPFNTYATSGGTNSTTAAGTLAAAAAVRYNTTTLPTSGRTYTYSRTNSYSSLPYTQNFETWTTRNSVNDVADATFMSTFPQLGNWSWRRHDEATTNSLWTGATAGTLAALTAAQQTGVARFHSYNVNIGGKGYMDFRMNFSSVGAKVLTFDYQNTSGTDALRVYLSVDGGLTFGTALTTQGVAAAWTSVTVALGSSTAANCVVRFEGTGDFGANGIGVDNISIFIPQPPTISSFTPTSLCPAGGQSVVITGTNFNGLSGAAAVTFNGVNAASYVVNSSTQITAVTPAITAGVITVTSSGGSGSSTSYTLATAPTVVLSANGGAICGVRPISASGAVSYVWTPAGSLSATTGSSVNFTGTANVTVNVTGTAANGCTGTASQAITYTAPPTITLSKTPDQFCGAGGPSTIAVTSTLADYDTYTWTALDGASLSTASGNSTVATVSATSAIQVIGSNSTTGCGSSAVASVGVYPLPTANLTTTANGVCPGTSATINTGLSAGNFTVASVPYVAFTAPASATTICSNGVASAGWSATANNSLDDGGWNGIPIGFSFNFFGSSFTTIAAGTNGLLMFGAVPGYGTGSGQLGQFNFNTTGGVFPNVNNPGNVIALMAADQYFGNGAANSASSTLKYWTQGYAPNRIFVIEYSDVDPCCSNGATGFTAQARLYETLGIVDVAIISKTAGSPTVGLQNAAKTIGAVAPGRQSFAGNITTPETWRFAPPSNYTTVWTANGAALPAPAVSSGTNIFSQNVSPAVTTLYDIIYTNQTTGCANAAGTAQVNMSVLDNTTPTGVSAVSSVAEAGSGSNFGLSLSGISSTDGLLFQWQSSTDGTTWPSTPSTLISSDFSSAPAGGTAYGPTASVTGGELVLTTNASNTGGYLINTSPSNENQFMVNFDYRMFDGGGADGMSLSFGPSMAADAGGGEAGEGTGLVVSFDTYSTFTQSQIIVKYGGTQIFANTAGAFDLRNNLYRNVNISVNAAGELNVSIAGTNLVSALALPGYLAADKSTWKFKFSGRAGGTTDKHSIDNLNIVIGSTSPSSTFPTAEATSLYYRCLVKKCVGSYVPSTTIFVPLTYCTPTGNAATYYISNFTTTNALTNFSNTSGVGTNTTGYSNYSADATLVCVSAPGLSVNFSITAPVTTSYHYIWIDWNNDLDFNDVGENVFSYTTYVNTITGSFTVPNTVVAGNYRMRVASNSGVATACGPIAFGEYEDYTITVVIPIPTISSVAATTVCPGETVTITGTNYYNITGVTFNGLAASSYTVVSPTSITAVVPALATTGSLVVTNAYGSATSPSAITVNGAPGIPTVSVTGNSTINIGATTELTSTTSGGTIQWYDAATGGTLLGTGVTLTSPVSCTAGTKTYYAQEVGTSCASIRGSASYTVRPLISTDPGNALICTAGGNVVLSGNVSGGTALTWSPNTNLSTTSGAVTTASPTVTTQYTFSATVAGCGPVSGTQNVGVIAGAAFTPTATPSALCEGGTSVLASNLASAGFTVSTITNTPSTSGSPTFLMNGGLTPVVPLTSGFNDDGGWGAIPIGFTYNFFGTNYTTVNASTNGLIQFGAYNAANLADYTYTTAFPTTLEPMNIIAGGACDLTVSNGTVSYWTEGLAPTRVFVISYNVNGLGSGNNTFQIKLFETTGIVEVHVTSNTAQTFANKAIGVNNSTGTVGNTAYNSTNALTNTAYRFIPGAAYTFQWIVGGSNASGASTSTSYTTPTLSTPGSVVYTCAATNPLTQCASEQPVTITVNPRPTAPVSGGNLTACSNITPQTLSVTAPAGCTIDWYGAASGGAVLAGGTGTATFSTSTAGSYYAQARNTTTGCTSPDRTEVVYTQTLAPAAPTVTTPVAFCENSIATALSATGVVSNTLNWYTVATGGTPSSSAPTPDITTATTLSYYVSQVDAGNSCESNRALITVKINATPAAPTTSAAGPYCENATASALSATADGLNTLNWYTLATGGSGSGTAPVPLTTPAGTTLYYVSQTAAYTLPTLTCESARASISVLVNPNITASVDNSATTTSLCTGGNIDFTATPTNGGATPSYQWQVNGANVGTDSPTYTLTPELFSDNGGSATYSGGLSNGLNGGSGFGAWSITAGANSGSFIGNPSNDGNGTAGIGTDAFGFYATGSAYLNALRTINGGMQVGDTLSFYWIFNWDANGGNKGFDFKNGGTTVFNINNGGFVSTITSSAGTANSAYGTTPMFVKLVRTSSTEYAFSMTSRSGGATYTNTITNSTSINGINFYIGGQNDGSGNRNMYVNNLVMKKYYSVAVNMTPSAQTCLSSLSATPSNAIVLGYAPSTPSVAIIAGATTTICPGTSLAFSISSSANLGSTPAYQWQVNGVDVPLATSSTFSSTTLVNGDVVSLVATSSISGGCLTSTTATSNTVSVTVQAPTAISTQPTDAAACLGATQVFSAAATGTGTISYQWFKTNVSITGNPTAITNSLTLAGLVSGSAADYYVRATGTCGSANSDTITLSLNPNTVITAQPVVASLCAGLDTSFTVAATGFGTLTYQWRKNGSAISGETNDTLVLSSVLAATAGTYSVLVIGGCNSLASNNVALTVNPLVNFVTQPAATPAVCAGTTANLSASVTGAGTLSYQWQLNGADVPSATSSTLAISNAQLVNDGLYTLIATSSLCGADTSSVSDLTINPVTAISTQPIDVSLCNGSDALFNVVTAGIGTINYQWRYNGTAIPGETNDTLLVNNITNTANAGTYSVVVTGGTCSSGTLNSTTVSLNIQSTTSAISDSQTASCVVRGGDWIHFYTNDGKLLVSINSNGNDLGNVTATSYVNASPIIAYACNTDVNPNYASAVLGRRWVITPENNLPAIIRLPFGNSEFTSLAAQSLLTANGNDDIFSMADIQLNKYSGLYENGDWQDNCTPSAGTSMSINQSGNGAVTTANGFVGTLANTSYAEFSIPSFSEFWLMHSGSPSALPVEMVSFAATCKEKEVEVKWTTASEQNSQNFIIENSRDLSNWITVGEVEAAGNSNQSIDYAIIDENPISGISYYRMKQVDLNGAQRIYGPISVSCSDTENSMVVFPNPTKGNFTVEISSHENYSNAQIQITDLTGKVINARSTNILEGKNQFTFEDLDLQLGTYIINLNTGNGKINPVRVVVN